MSPDQYLAHLRAVYEAFELPFELIPPASEQELAAIQQELGPVEPDLAALWRMTRGSSADCPQPFFQRPGFIDSLDFLTPPQALDQARSMQARAQRMWDMAGPASTDKRLTGHWWEQDWLPFASFYGDIVLLIDNHPGPEGQAGQVIAYVHDPDKMSWIAPSFAEYLRAAAASIDEDREEFLLAPLDEL